MGVIISKFFSINLYKTIKTYLTGATLTVPTSKEPSLSSYIRGKIQIDGPLTVADYMRESLYNTEGGYYFQNDVMGDCGDYTTAPEMSQVFGEMLGIWFLYECAKCGSPRPLQIVEFGPGTGSLLRDMLRLMKQFTKLKDIDISLIEICPRLSRRQSQMLCSKSELVDGEVYYQRGKGLHGSSFKWYKNLDDVPKGMFTLYIAHEFFDTLPIHKFEKTKNGFKEMLVDIDPTNNEKFRLVHSEKQSRHAKFLSKGTKDPRQHIEKSPESIFTVQNIGHRIETDGGLALLVDYGHMGNKGNTFRAFRKHKLHDPLLEPGTADLTADVNFLDLKKAALDGNKVLVFGPVTQKQFFMRLEKEQKFAELAQHSKTLLNSNNWREQLGKCYKTLTRREGIADRVKFLAILPNVIEVLLRKHPPLGFDRQET